MYQIDNSSVAPLLPASTSPGAVGFFTDGNPATGTAPTIVPAEFLNMLMLEVLGVLSAAGVTPSKTNFTQLATAIRGVNRQAVILADTGTAGAYAAVNSPALTALPATGYAQWVNISHPNPGAATYSPDGLAAKPIYGLGLQPLQGGELPVGIAVFRYLVQAGVNGGNGAWIITESLGGAVQIAHGSASSHAATLDQIQSGALSSALDTGTANTYVCAFTPAITVRSEQQPLRFKVKTANTGASTFNDGLGAVALVGGAHSALQGGELIANGDAWVQWNTSIGGGSYILLFCTGAPEQVAPAAQSSHAINMGQLFGSLKVISRFTSNSSFTVPNGVTTIYVSGCAGGGGGGGGGGSSSGAPTSGAGGGGGGAGQQIFRVPYTVTPGQVIAIGIGTAGAAGAGGFGAASGGAGTAGGATTIGSLVTLSGGSAGLGGVSGGAGGAGGAGYPGGSDGADCTNNQCTGIGGMGGSSSFGGGGGGGRAGSGGGAVAKAAAGNGGGGGGGGGSYGATGSGGNGAVGTGGSVIIES